MHTAVEFAELGMPVSCLLTASTDLTAKSASVAEVLSICYSIPREGITEQEKFIITTCS